MKTVVWYLPNGAGGMAAMHRSHHISRALVAWAADHALDIDISKSTSFYSENGLRYYVLHLSEENATIFALTWNNGVPRVHYEYIK